MVDGVGITQENDPNKQKVELYVIDLSNKNQIECLKENDNKLEKDDATNANNKNNELESAKLRDYIAFWLLACCNNFGYTLLLTAAHDILKDSGDFVVSLLILYFSVIFWQPEKILIFGNQM